MFNYLDMNTLLAGWSKICPGCNLARKYPESFIGKKVRGHWKKGCLSHDAYVEVYRRMSLRRIKARKHPPGNVIAISREDGDGQKKH